MTHSTRRRRGRPLAAERTQGPFAPYAPVRSIDIVVSYHRDRGFAEPIDRAAVERAGVAASMSARTLQALRFLGLVDDSGYTTEEFELVRRARDDELPSVLGAQLRGAYAEIFAQLDPRSATDRQLNDAFRAHEPSPQRPKMISLFRALCQRAGLLESRAGGRPVGEASLEPRIRRGRAQGGNAPRAHYALVRGLIETLPPDGHWTSSERDRWLNAFQALLDLSVRVDDTPANEAQPPDVRRRPAPG